MNKIKFVNYLKQYLLYVSKKETLSVHSLYKESKRNARIIDPLILYCVFNGKTLILNKYTNQYAYLYNDLLDCKFNFEKFKEYSFVKIYDSYCHKINQVKYDNKIKSQMRKNIILLQKEKHISTYRLYSDLHLNHGNVNSFIKNNDLSKLSLENVEKITNYLYLSK